MWEKDAYISFLPEVIGFWIVGAVNCSLPDFPCWALILKIKSHKYSASHAQLYINRQNTHAYQWDTEDNKPLCLLG